MRAKLIELIPEFEEFQDAELRDTVLGIREKAVKAGGWKVEELNRLPFTLLIPDLDLSIIDHVRGVTRVALGAADALVEVYGAERYGLNRDHVLAGALLHDIGKLLEYKMEGGKAGKSDLGKLLRHPFSGVGICYGEGLPDEVLHMIAVHAKEGDLAPRTAAGYIVYHADFINFDPLHHGVK